ncbi:putative membrane protein [Propionicimonas paludicola]|uniref:Putative membrane protein n=1 Tax=Propionicimonas paludicola TaxID=185243 RepID=A0A2A9CR27_9ACTN|nr:DUF2231 domain-containing protein [Propionicimonas paludicola]PFG16062.1 putative membrane protein [Propionicimonas paludicola]
MASASKSIFTEFAEYLEEQPVLGRLSDRLELPLRHLLGHGPASDLLRGRALGHALHPVVVQLPIGALTSAMILDLTQGPGAARQSRLLTGLACLAALPAAATGLAEWTHADPRSRRVGVAHLGLNLLGVAGATTSYLLRRRNWTPAAAVWSGLAMAAVGLSGALGGHLTLVRKYGSHDQPSDGLGASSAAFGSATDPEEHSPTE